jgi:chloride channel protein, CIC family
VTSDEALSPTDPIALLRSRRYLVLLVIAAVLGVPISAVAYFFLQLVAHIQGWVFKDLPSGLGFDQVPAWWPIPPLVVAGVLVGLTLRYLPGDGGEKPAEGFKPAGPRPARDIAGVAVAAIVSLGLGAVIGPEAPLIALGAALAAAAMRAVKRDAGQQAVALIGASGSFAAISALLGSPLLGAFLLMEASGLGGPMLGLVLLPGLLSAGIGALVFLGLDSLTGLGTVSLAIPGLPPFARPDVAEFGWALVIGVLAAIAGAIIRRCALELQARTEHRPVVSTPVVGLGVALLVILYTQTTNHSSSDVLF